MRGTFIAAVLLLASCKDQRPPQPTSEQSQQLNEAEDMLNSVANEEEPANRSVDASNSSD